MELPVDVVTRTGNCLVAECGEPDHPRANGSPILRSVLPDDAPAAPPGLLKLTMEQMEGIENIRLGASRRRVMAYLREVDDEATCNISDQQLHALVTQYEGDGIAIGLKSERAHMKWAYLMSVSDGDMSKHPETRKFFLESSKHPDERIDDLLDMFDGVWTPFESTV